MPHHQSKIDQLLAQHCPEGVEFKALGEVFNLKNGYTPSKSKNEYWENGNIPWFRMEDIRENGRILLNSIQHITLKAVKGGKLFEANSIIMSTTATIGEHALISVEYLSNQRFTNFSLKSEFRKILNIKFVYYFFFILDKIAKKSVNVSSFPSVKMNELKKWKIPIPPLPIQEAIVDILDKFTALEAELEAELEARKKQYNYYRDGLLDFAKDDYISDNISKLLSQHCPEGVEFKALGEVGEFYGGLKKKSKSDFTNGNAKFITYMNIFSNISINIDDANFVKINENENQNKIQYGDVLFTGSSENVEECGMSSVLTKNINEPLYLNSFCFGFRFEDTDLFSPEFLKYLFRDKKIRKQISKTANGVTRFNISKKQFSKIQIPIPPLPIQEAIVRILDKFDALTNSLSEGLPAEIAARRQQYNHYRNQLLTFKEKH